MSRNRCTATDNTGTAGKFPPRLRVRVSAPMQPQDVEIERSLAAMEEHVEQCRAALATAREGDATAMEALSAEVDAMAGRSPSSRPPARAAVPLRRPAHVRSTLCPSSDRSAPVRSVTGRPRSASGRRARSGSRCAPAARDHELADAGLGVREAVLPAAPGDDYAFVIDGYELPDPCSRWQPDGLRGPSRVLDTGAFEWTDAGFEPPALADSVIYELHVGTFTRGGHVRRGRSRTCAACASSASPRSS